MKRRRNDARHSSGNVMKQIKQQIMQNAVAKIKALGRRPPTQPIDHLNVLDCNSIERNVEERKTSIAETNPL